MPEELTTMENQEVKEEKTDIGQDSQDFATDTEEKGVDIAGIAELGLMIVGGVAIAKTAFKHVSRLGHKLADKRREKKEAKDAKKEAKKAEDKTGASETPEEAKNEQKENEND